MGCGGTKGVQNIFVKKYVRNFSEGYKGKQERYNFLHKKCDFTLIARDLSEKVVEIEQSPLQTICYQVEKSFVTFESQIKENQITQSEYLDLMYETVTTKIITNHFQIPNYNIFKTLPLMYPILFPKTDGLTEQEEEIIDDKIEGCKEALKTLEKEFEENLLSIVYDLKGELRKLQNLVLLGINRNLKFNPTFQPQIFNLVLTPYLLENEELINDIAELIEYGEKLQIVSILINPVDENGNELDNFNLNISDHTMLNRILSGVANNKKIKALFIQCLREHKIVLAPESANLLINKLQSETLLAFHIGKFTLSSEFLGKLCFQILSTRSLMFFGLDNKKIWTFLLNKLLPALKANTSLLALSLTGFIMEQDKELIKDFIEKLREENKMLRGIYFGQNSLVTYLFNPENIKI